MRWLKVPKASPYQANLWEQDAVAAETNDKSPASKKEPIVADRVSLAERKEGAYQRWQSAEKRKKRWVQILQEVAHGMAFAVCDGYLHNTVLLTIEGAELAVGMANESGKDWLGKSMSRRRKAVLKR